MNTTSTAILAALIAGGTAAALAAPADPWPATFSGYATAIDGDTLRVGGVRVRLAGIDAPEAGQTCQRALSCWPCGPEATRLMRRMLVRDPQVTCRAHATDRYGRTVATCRNSEGDLGGRLVAQGMATAARRYSLAYVDHEAAAKAEALGIWSGSFAMPEQWQYYIDH